jgi:hypothetical protein
VTADQDIRIRDPLGGAEEHSAAQPEPQKHVSVFFEQRAQKLRNLRPGFGQERH